MSFSPINIGSLQLGSSNRYVMKITIGNTVHENSKFTLQREGQPAISGTHYEYHGITSAQYNQLKAKLFNLIESVSTDKIQQEALKGLVKGFCNIAYTQTIEDLDSWMRNMGFDVEFYAYGSNSLENNT